MEQILVLGNGGHAVSLIDALERDNKYEIMGCVVNNLHNQSNLGYPIIGSDSDLNTLYQNGIKYAAIGIGYLGKSDLREKLYAYIKAIGFCMPVICDPSAIISKNVRIEEGTFIGKGAIINTGVSIGKACIINSGAIVEHNCNVGEFSHISVGSVVCGGVSIGRATFVGANATVIQEKKIGRNCVIGAGVVIRKDVEDCCIVWNRNNVNNMRKD